jgi:ABC-type phosphate transport system substrate-binding protein
MKASFIRAAVAAAVAGTVSVAANAAAYNIHASGASAQRTFWEGDLEAIAGGTFGSEIDGGGVQTCTLTKTSAALSTGGLVPPATEIPDLHALVCNISANRGATPPALPTGVAVGDTITLYYEAEYGSVWGIAPFVPGTNANTRAGGNRLELVVAAVPPAADVTVANAVFGAGYDRNTDTCGGCAGLQGPVPVDIALADMDPILWASTDNWAYSTGDNANQPTKNGTGTNNVINILSIPGQGQPTLAQLEALEQTWTEINGQVFSVVVDASANPTKAVTNLSTQSVRAILTGQYKTWSQVPEVGAAGDPVATSIVVCRRDHGSGSQVAQSQYFTQTECGGNNGINGTGAAAGAPTREVSQNTSPLGASVLNLDQTVGFVAGIGPMNPVENLSTNDVKSCLSANPGASIGVISLGPAAAYNTLSIDNVQANAHNAAMGFYKFAFTTWGFNNTPNSQSGNVNAQNIAARLIADAQKPGNGALPKEPGSMAGGVWTSASPKVVYAVQDLLNPAPTIAANTVNPSTPIAVWRNTPKSSCYIPLNNNH